MSSEELFFQSLGINDLTAYQNYKIKEVLLDEKKREFNVVMMLEKKIFFDLYFLGKSVSL